MSKRQQADPEAVRKAREKERERKKADRREQQEIQQAFAAQNDSDTSVIRELLSDDDITAGGPEDLQEVTIAKIENLLGQDVLLANFTSAQENDIRFKLEVLRYKVLGTHPPSESEIQGPLRAYLWDDEMEDLHSLTQQERLIIDDLFETLKARVTRGREGFERKQQNTSIALSESASNEERNGSDGIFTGLFD
jgi:hypothetical protein